MSQSLTQLYNIEIEEGTDYDLQITYTEPSTGLPVDLTNYTAEIIVELKHFITANGFYLKFDTTGGEIAALDATGVINVNIPASATLNQGMFQGQYNLYVISPLSKRTKVAKGLFTILASALG